MKRKKQKKPNNTMRPSRKTVWSRAMSRFHLSPEELAKARAAGFTPTLMDEVATGGKTKRSIHDKLPLHATAGQVGRIKREIRERYETLFGDAPPPATATSQVKRSKEARLEARGKSKLVVTIPTALRAHVTVECARAGLKLDEGVQAALEARFPRGNASPPASAPLRAA
jgi:hypothetical protein